jgi:Tfp pilus assembly protein PilO
MQPVVYLILGAIVGGIVVYIIVSSRLKEFYSRQISEEQMKQSELDAKAKSAEAVNAELRQQLSQKEATLEQLRNELDAERKSRVEAR